jgi:hypothetical protein
MQEKQNSTGFVTLKELSAVFKLKEKQMKKELKLIKGLELEPYQRYFSPLQLEIIYKHLGNPLTD